MGVFCVALQAVCVCLALSASVHCSMVWTFDVVIR